MLSMDLSVITLHLPLLWTKGRKVVTLDTKNKTVTDLFFTGCGVDLGVVGMSCGHSLTILVAALAHVTTKNVLEQRADLRW